MTKEDAIKYLKQLYPNGGHCWLDEQRIEAISMAVKALQEEPVSDIDFEQELYKAFGQVKDFTLGMRIAKRFYDMGKKSREPVNKQNLSNVQRTVKDWKEEPVSEDLGEYLYELSKQFPEVSFAKLSRIGVRVAKWQKEHLRTVGNRTMSRAEKFISEHTRNCSNVFVNPLLGGTEENHPWLTPDQARRAVEIAREEVIEKAIGWIKEINNRHHIMRYSDSCEPPISELTEWFKNYMKEGGKDE